MNTPSSRLLKILGTLAASLCLGSCILGPWDFYPDNPPVFRGIWLSGYAMAGRPLQQVCMEKLLDLDEEYTDAFAFFDSATVRVTGRFGDSTRTLALAQKPDAPNCFVGDTGARILPGQAYDLEARVVWDSSGRTVAHTLTARARVPQAFSIRDTAVAPGFAKSGNLPANIFDPEFVLALPEDVRQDPVLQGYFAGYLAIAGDTAAAAAYLAKNRKAIEERLVELLKRDQEPYAEGDTLFYLSGILNTMSHYYTSDRSEDVRGVLITHRFDSTAERPATAFEGFFGFEPDSSEFYYEGSVRRLGMYPAATSPKGYNLLDSIGVVNSWFHTRLNRLYFYGMEQAYVDYVFTAIEGEQDPRVKMKSNVNGGRGFFVGGVPDSFDLHIKADTTVEIYPMQKVRAFECREDGWDSDKDCRSYLRPYCQGNGWTEEDCGGDAIRANLEARFAGDTALLRLTAAAADSARSDTAAVDFGTLHFCAENDFPDLGGTCQEAARDCNRPGINGCKDVLWDFCKDNLWRTDLHPQCGPALAWYCRDNPRRSEVICRNADAFCRANPGNPACR